MFSTPDGALPRYLAACDIAPHSRPPMGSPAAPGGTRRAWHVSCEDTVWVLMVVPGSQRLPINIFETTTEILVVAAMPGVEPEDISVRLDGPVLHLESKERGEDAVFKYSKHEWSYGPYQRWLEIPQPVDGTRANVTYGNGVLTIGLPKSEDYVDATIAVTKVGHARGVHRGHTG